MTTERQPGYYWAKISQQALIVHYGQRVGGAEYYTVAGMQQEIHQDAFDWISDTPIPFEEPQAQSPELKAVLSEIKFPVRYNADTGYLQDGEGMILLEMWWLHLLKSDTTDDREKKDALGEYICKLINDANK